MTRTEFVEAVSTANQLIPQLSMLIGVAGFAIDQLWGIWSANNPDKTFEDFIADLRKSAAELKDLSAEQLAARGFVQAADGTWYRSSTV